ILTRTQNIVRAAGCDVVADAAANEAEEEVEAELLPVLLLLLLLLLESPCRQLSVLC
ncbi:hypothetical protein A2U01_0097195, partial [Trifolium medium]|nr:hypothetical protein [Trifolium medium]